MKRCLIVKIGDRFCTLYRDVLFTQMYFLLIQLYSYIYIFISRCYVVAKCNMKHIALLKSHIALLKSHIALTTKRPSGIIKLNILS